MKRQRWMNLGCDLTWIREGHRSALLAFLVAIVGVWSLEATHAGDISFWNTQRKGANFFPNIHRKERFEDAAKVGIKLARLAGNKWLNGRPEAERGDFLIGPKDQYTGIVAKDLQYLLRVLDNADKSGIKVVFTMLSLPGSRWLQHNCKDGKCVQQHDLWEDFKFHQQSAAFWRDLAKALKSHPAIAGYNILNEPCPERANKPVFRDWYTMDYNQWYQRVKGTPADLNRFYKTVIDAIREVDRDTPIVVDSGFYANPYAYQILDPAILGDVKLIYAIHHYEPSKYLMRANKGQYRYPGDVPSGELDTPSDEGAEPPYAPVEHWDKQKLESYFKVVADWSKKYGIPAKRIYVAEFGGYRQVPGLIEYFRDVIDLFNRKGWHWSFYSFREDDSFPPMDYELGTGAVNGVYWKCQEDYTCTEAGVYDANNPLWKTILSGLK